MTPEAIGIFLVCFIAIIPAIDAVRRWSGKGESRDITPQPLEVVAVKDYVTRADCRRAHESQSEREKVILTALTARETTLDATLRDMDLRHHQRTDELRRELKSDNKGVHERVDEVLRAVSRIEGKLDK